MPHTLLRSLALAVLLLACSGRISGDPESLEETPPGGEGNEPPVVLGPEDAGTDGGTQATGDGGTPANDGGTVADAYDAGTEGDGNHRIGPVYADAPELKTPAAAPKGTVYRFSMSSADSVIYPGLNGAYTRPVAVYIPKQYVNGTAAPFIVVQDGSGYVDHMQASLDTLIAAKAVPPMIAIMVNSGGGDGRGSERGLEYDRVSEDYSRFVETELLPAVRNDVTVKKAFPKLAFTANPEGRAAMGCSSGGSAAFTMGWFRPDLYRRILTLSGTFVNQYPEPAHPHGAWEYHESLVAATPTKPLRVFLQVGTRDNDLDARFGDGMHNWMTANAAMASKLSAKGYHYRFLTADDATHCDQRVRRQELPDALRWLWRGYPLK